MLLNTLTVLYTMRFMANYNFLQRKNHLLTEFMTQLKQDQNFVFWGWGGGASEPQWTKLRFCGLPRNLNYKHILLDIYA